MINKTISIPYEISLKLKEEENASALITKLLINYFKFNSNNLRDIEEQIDQIKSKDKEEVNENLDRLKQMKKKIIVENKEKEKIVKTTKEKEEKFKKTFHKIWKKETGKEPTDKQYNKFIDEFNQPNSKTNIFSFIKDNA